jgi:hypothetical protein
MEMSDARESAAWDRVAVLWAQAANENRSAGSKVWQPWDVHPYRDRLDYQPDQADLSGLRDLVEGVSNGEKC